MKSSIIDVPRKYSEADLFGIQKYQNALVKFIRLTNTPITIALQGEWGSGKTSLMNCIMEFIEKIYADKQFSFLSYEENLDFNVNLLFLKYNLLVAQFDIDN